MDKLIAPAQSLAFSASYIAVLILLGVILTFRVVFVRRSARISLGDGDNTELRKRIRAHGNFAEQAPWIALALIVLPFLGAREWMVHLVGVTGVTGRILHAIAVSKGDSLLKYRVMGMVLTTGALVLGALLLLVCAWR
ncbi:MAG: MAPEG family protein [Proteobacteria bacterium]|nr:MAPEG family protein [Pseudomonadota bacterium]